MNWILILPKIIKPLFKMKSRSIENTQDKEKMTADVWLKLPLEKQEKLCQSLSPYEESEWEIFKAVEKEFIREFGNQPGVGKVQCSLAPMLGPFNCINVDIIPGQKNTKLPKIFMGFPIKNIAAQIN